MVYPDSVFKMKKLEENIIFVSSVFFKIVIWVLGVIVIYWLLLKITGHSPTSETVFIGVFGAIVTLMGIMLSFIINIKGEIGEIKRFMKESDRRFYALARDFREFKNHVH